MTIAWEGSAPDFDTRDREGQSELFDGKRPVGQLQTAKTALTYILAGNAYFTLRSKKTGTRYTYRVNKPKPEDKDGGRLGIKWFVALLSGPDNTEDYTYLGMIVSGNRFTLTRASKMTMTSAPVRAISWALTVLNAGKLPDDLEIWHEGRCGRCGRTLTVPESVAAGIGPECAGRMAK